MFKRFLKIIALAYIYQLAMFGELVGCGSKIHSKMHPVSCTNTHHVVTGLVNHVMVKNKKDQIFWVQNITFLLNKKLLKPVSQMTHFEKITHFDLPTPSPTPFSKMAVMGLPNPLPPPLCHLQPPPQLFFLLSCFLAESQHIWCAILHNDNMDLNMSSLGTLVPEEPWCMFYATRCQVYWGLTHSVVF